MLRAIFYPPLPGASDLATPAAQGSCNSELPVQLSCGEHSDYGLLTFVLQEDHVSALQVRLPAMPASRAELCAEVCSRDGCSHAAAESWPCLRMHGIHTASPSASVSASGRPSCCCVQQDKVLGGPCGFSLQPQVSQVQTRPGQPRAQPLQGPGPGQGRARGGHIAAMHSRAADLLGLRCRCATRQTSGWLRTPSRAPWYATLGTC